MRILMVHNYYQQRGGEDESTDQEISLLRKSGHEVRLYSRHNDEIKSFSPLRKAALFFEPTWSPRAFKEIRRVIQEFRPDVVHVQNFFPLISPSVFYACGSFGVPVVYTLRDYRLLCSTGWLYRNGTVCEECLHRSIWRGTLHGCYRDSLPQSAAVSLMLSVHRSLGTWRRNVSLFIALTEFSKQKFIEGGLPGDKIAVRPNFLEDDPGPGGDERQGALFVGRLSHEKGVEFLLDAWENLPDISLKVVGDGPLRPWMKNFVKERRLQNVTMAGFMPLPDALREMQKASFLVMPSVWYETFGRTIIEAYACGTPVIASRLGAMADLVEDGRTGLLFEPGNADDFVEKIRQTAGNPDAVRKWGRQARSAFEAKYSAEAAAESLVQIYAAAMNG